MTEEKKKKKIGIFGWIVIVFLVLSFIGVMSGKSGTTNTTQTDKVETELKQEKTLQEHYNRHKNYIWYVCQEGLKLIDGGPYNFEGPTYAGEYMGKFIVKGTNNDKLFRCEYVAFDNERGMNLENVKYE